VSASGGVFEPGGFAAIRKIAGRGLRLPAFDHRDVGQKPVATAGDGLDEAGIFGRISQCFSNFADRFIEAVIEIHDRLRPKSFAKFLPDHQLSRLFQQHGQQLEWLFLQPDPFAKPGELAGSRVGFENPKLETLERLCGLLHGKPERSEDSSASRAQTSKARLQGITASKSFI
jgi:hypothetical protein